MSNLAEITTLLRKLPMEADGRHAAEELIEAAEREYARLERIESHVLMLAERFELEEKRLSDAGEHLDWASINRAAARECRGILAKFPKG